MEVYKAPIPISVQLSFFLTTGQSVINDFEASSPVLLSDMSWARNTSGENVIL